MPTAKKWIEELSDGEPVEGVVFGCFEYDDGVCWEGYPQGKLLSFDEAMPWLVRDFDQRNGAAEHPPVVAWTKTWIISFSQWDTMTDRFRIHRNPTAYLPCMPGG